MKPIFADTGYWLALLVPSDSLHEMAWSLASRLRGRLVVTTRLVLTELLNDLGSRGARQRRDVAQFVSDLEAQDDVAVIGLTDDLFDAAFRLFEAREDKSWSLTDCASFVVCEREGITEALAHDQHFVQAGLRALLREG